MKQLMTVFVMMLFMSITVMGQTSTQKAKEANKQTATTTVTVSTAAADSASTDSVANKDEDTFKSLKGGEFESKGEHFDFPFGKDSSIVPIIAIIAVFGMPVLIVLIVSIVNYKNRKAQYKLAEKALENGKDIPEGLFSKTKETDIRSKGIKNIFVGIGLGIFLWALTGEFGLGCIGFMIMFFGIGQWLIAQSNKKDGKERPFTDMHNDNRAGESSTRMGENEPASKETDLSGQMSDKE
ncbi:DUF6249 domain-containing protein [Bacteroides sedimenti]